jgi:hypothetical protein
MSKQLIISRSHFVGGGSSASNAFPVMASSFEAVGTTRFRVKYPNGGGILQNFSPTLETAPGSGNTLTLTIWQNGSSTSVAVTFSGTATTAAPSANTITMADGDDLMVEITVTGTPAATWIQSTVEWVPTVSGQQLYGGYTQSYLGGGGGGGYKDLFFLNDTAEASPGNLSKFIVTQPGTITAWTFYAIPAFGTPIYEFCISVDRGSGFVDQDGSGGTPDTRITMDGSGAFPMTVTASFSLHLDAGDIVTYRHTNTTGGFPSAIRSNIGVAFTSDDPDTFMYGVHFGSTPSGTKYIHVSSPGAGGAQQESATESDVQFRIPTGGLLVTGYTLKSDTPTNINGRTYTVRKNGADTAITAVTASEAASATGSVNYVSGDVLDMGQTGGVGSATNGYYTLIGESAAVTDPIQKVTQVVLLVATDEYADEDPPPETDGCTGGGAVAIGTNPTDGDSLATATGIHAWMVFTVGGTTYTWGKVGINIGSLAVQPRVLSFGAVTRALSDDKGGFESARMTVMLSDYDRTVRGLHNSQTLLNQSVTVYAQSESGMRSAGNPWKVFRGVVRDLRPESDLKFRLDLEDPLTLSMSAFAQEKLVPPTLISVSDSTADQGIREAPAPVLYGSLSDEDEDEPIGTIEAPFIGTETVSGLEYLGNFHKHLIGLSATHNVRSIFIGDPLSGTPPTRRARAGASEYGTRLYVPHRDGWFGSEYYTVQDDERWTFLYVDQTHPGADLARYGKIPIAVNLCGREEQGDGTDDTIDSLPLQFLHFLNTEVAQSVGDADWPAIATRDSYALFDTLTFSAVKTRSEARISGGYVGAFMLGHSFKQITLREAIKQFCRSGDFDIGINRHGQIMLTMLDRTSTASSAVTFTDQSDILKGSFSIDPCLDAVENRVNYVYARNYLKTLQQLLTEEGTRPPREPYDGTWKSGLQTLNDTTEQTALGETRASQTLELEMVRDQDTADDVAAQRLALRKSSKGRAEATFDCTLSKGYNIELGDVIAVTHFQGISTTGWSARRCQVRRHVVDLDKLTVKLTVRDVDNLLA